MSVKGMADLHFHTECSGCAYMPLYSIIPAAERLGLRAIAATDHDSVSGCIYLKEAAKDSAVEYIPAVELSTADRLHILGYYINPEDEGILSYTEREKAYGRRLFLEKLHIWKKRGGFLPDDLDAFIEEVASLRPIGETNIKQIVDHLLARGYYPSKEAAFDDVREKLEGAILPVNTPPTAEYAIDTVTAAGGVAVVAHPPPTRMDDVIRLLEHGAIGVGILRGKGIYKCPENRKAWLDYAAKHDIVLTGGSDWHGPVELWNISDPTAATYDSVRNLKSALERMHDTNRIATPP